MPVRREVQHVDAELLEHAGVVLFDQRAVEPVVEAHHQRLQAQLLHHVPELENAILPAGIRNDAVIETLVTVLRDELHHLGVALIPIDLGVSNFDLRADAAGSVVIERRSLRRFRQQALATAQHFKNSRGFMICRGITTRSIHRRPPGTGRSRTQINRSPNRQPPP